MLTLIFWQDGDGIYGAEYTRQDMRFLKEDGTFYYLTGATGAGAGWNAGRTAGDRDPHAPGRQLFQYERRLVAGNAGNGKDSNDPPQFLPYTGLFRQKRRIRTHCR